jgi:hypothetical protein
MNKTLPPLWSSGQISWLQNQRSGFDTRIYHIFWEVVGLERRPLSLLSIIPVDGRMTETCCGYNIGGGEEELLRWRTIIA